MSGIAVPDGTVWFGNTAGSTLVVRIRGDLGGEPSFRTFDTQVPGPSLPAIDGRGRVWFGTTGATGEVVRISGEPDAPLIEVIDRGVESPGFPVRDNRDSIWFGNAAADGRDLIVRID